MKYTVKIAEREFEATVLHRSTTAITFEVSGQQYQVEVHPHGRSAVPQSVAATLRPTPISPKPSSTRPRAGSGEVRAPMPGIVVQVIAQEGASVSVGDPLIVIEAMKMENSISAPISGVVRRIETGAGKQVNGGDLLILIEAKA